MSMYVFVLVAEKQLRDFRSESLKFEKTSWNSKIIAEILKPLIRIINEGIGLFRLKYNFYPVRKKSW